VFYIKSKRFERFSSAMLLETLHGYLRPLRPSHSFIRSFIHSFIYSFIYSFVNQLMSYQWQQKADRVQPASLLPPPPSVCVVSLIRANKELLLLLLDKASKQRSSLSGRPNVASEQPAATISCETCELSLFLCFFLPFER